MKRWIPTLFLLGAAHPTWAQTAENRNAEGPVVSATNSVQTEISISRSGPAIVRDTRRVRLESGPNRLRFFNVPNSDNLDSTSLQLSIAPEVRVLASRNGTAANSEVNLTQYIGKRVSLLRQIGSTEKVVSGTLLNTTPILLETADGVLLNPSGDWLLPKEPGTPTGEQTGRYIEWPVETAQTGEFSPELLYLTPGLKWSSAYGVRLNQSEDKVAFRGWLNIVNGTGANYSGVRLRIRDVTPADWIWPQAVNIPRGTSNLVLADTEVPVNRLLFMNHVAFGANYQNAHPQRSVTFQNSTANGLGNNFPAGPVTFWRQDEDGSMIYSKLESLAGGQNVAKDANITFPLGPDESITVDRSSTARLLNPVTREWTVNWTLETKRGGEAQTVQLNELFPNGAKITESSIPLKLQPDGYVTQITVSIAKDQPYKIKYVVTSPVNG